VVFTVEIIIFYKARLLGEKGLDCFLAQSAHLLIKAQWSSKSLCGYSRYYLTLNGALFCRIYP
jgi:hypothetical protein